jgi:hypothetical protein
MVRLKHILITSIAMATLAIGLQAQAPAPAAAAKNFKDRPEYDLYQEIIKPDATPAARLQNLDKWKAGYAASEYADIRLKIYLVTYQQLNNHRAAVDTAVEILKAEPNDLSSLTEIAGYGLTLVPGDPKATLSPANKADLDTVEKTARYILGNLDAIYAADKKPQGMTDPAWAAAKPAMQKFAQFTIARVADAQKDTAKSEGELTKTLEVDPTNTQAAYRLGQILLSQQKEHPDKMPKALFLFARAASYDGQGALPAANRTAVDKFLTGAYATFHTDAKHPDPKGLADLKNMAKASALPPADFKLASIVEILTSEEAVRKQKEGENPMLAFWTDIKENLTADNGAAYWEAMKGAGLPGGHNGVMKFKGKLVSATPETKPKELTIAIAGEAADVKIMLTDPLPGMMEPGGELSFSGEAKEFSKEPYMVTFESEPGDIEGWTGTGPVAAPTKKKAAAPGAGKKKQ